MGLLRGRGLLTERWCGPVSAIGISGPRLRKALRRVWLHGLLVLMSAFFMMPLLWTLSMSLKTGNELLQYPPKWIPEPVNWSNYAQVFDVLPFATFYRNSVVLSLLVVVGDLLMGSLVAYGFARFRFPGRDLLFLMVIGVLMLPGIVTLIPEFILMKWLGWLNTMLPLWVPHFLGGSPVIIFIFRQFFLTIPRDLDEAAVLDGAGVLRVFSHVLVPLAKPAYITAAIFSWLGVWNDFLRPMLYLRRTETFTLAIGLKALSESGAGAAGYYMPSQHLLMAGAILATIPGIFIFLIGQRYMLMGIELQTFK